MINKLGTKRGGANFPLNESFNVNAGAFTLLGNAVVTGGRLVIPFDGDKATVGIGTLGRGIYLQAVMRCDPDDIDFGAGNFAVWFSDDGLTPNGYGVGVDWEGNDEYYAGILLLTNFNTLLSAVVDGSPTTTVDKTYRLEIPVSGNILIKVDGVTRISVANTVTNIFKYIIISKPTYYEYGGSITSIEAGYL
jgi:hypothetical protein